MPSSSDQTRIGRTLTLGGGAESSLEERRFEPSVPLAVKTPLGHTFRRRLAVRQQSRGARWRLSAMSLIVCANISQRICAIAPSRAPDARAIFGHVT
jgi:hypothetical protein